MSKNITLKQQCSLKRTVPFYVLVLELCSSMFEMLPLVVLLLNA